MNGRPSGVILALRHPRGHGHCTSTDNGICELGHAEVAMALLEKGADVHAETGDGNTPLLWACFNGNIGGFIMITSEQCWGARAPRCFGNLLSTPNQTPPTKGQTLGSPVNESLLFHPTI